MMARNQNWLVGVASLILAILIPHILTHMGEEYLIGTASRIVIYGLAALSLNLILGYGGMISFGHAAYFIMSIVN